MSSASGPGSTTNVKSEPRADIQRVESLADLVDVTGAPSEHMAYFRAKQEWGMRHSRDTRIRGTNGIPGDVVEMDGVRFHVHGITHSGTDAERDFLVDHVSDYIDSGATVFCEQGIRPLFFEEMDVEEMDDYQWATARSSTPDRDNSDKSGRGQFATLGAEVDALQSRLRRRVFSIVESVSERLGGFSLNGVGRLLSDYLTDHEDAATGTDYEAFRKSRAAARHPVRLAALQDHYWSALLPPPVEREWLRRHDPHLEVVTHARNARMADYAVYHNTGPGDVHLLVGAAHQPGIVYYLEGHRDGRRSLDSFDLL